ncbi:MAG: hypothetical protein IPK28_15080 [Devosia sp.]|nr:hypothetical protein [Devosia sp.]
MATIPPWSLPPSPLPRYARPGGYSMTGAAANPYAPKPGPLGQLLGWGDNPIYQSLRPLMQDVGYGLLSGQSFQDGLAKGIERNGQMEPWRQQQAVLASQFQTDYATKDSTARNILQLGDAYKDIADAVSNGAMNPKEGWNEAFKRQSDARAKSELDSRNKANAQFLRTRRCSSSSSTGP